MVLPGSTALEEMLAASVETGCFLEAEVEGLISCAGEGWYLMEAAWMVSASPIAGFDIMRSVHR